MLAVTLSCVHFFSFLAPWGLQALLELGLEAVVLVRVVSLPALTLT